MEITVNYLAVLAAAVVAFTFGALWHSQIGFGTWWKTQMGFTDESMRQMPLGPKSAMTLGFLFILLFAYALARTMAYVQVHTAQTALILGIWIWLGFVITTLAGGWLWEGKSFKVFLFNCVYQLFSICAMAMVILFWPISL